MMSLYVSGSKGAQIIGNQNLDAVNLRDEIEYDSSTDDEDLWDSEYETDLD